LAALWKLLVIGVVGTLAGREDLNVSDAAIGANATELALGCTPADLRRSLNGRLGKAPASQIAEMKPHQRFWGVS
jgi:hypothetical protein